MREVAGPHVSERANRERIAARHASSIPGIGRQMPEERHRGGTQVGELVDVARPRSGIGACVRDRDVLIEARERAVEPRANQNARKMNSRSVSLMCPTTSRMLHLPGA